MASDAPVPGLLGTSPGLARAAPPTVAKHNRAQPTAWESTSCAFYPLPKPAGPGIMAPKASWGVELKLSSEQNVAYLGGKGNIPPK